MVSRGAALLLGALLAAAVALSVGCSCPLRHPQQHFCEADFVANVKVRRVVTLPDGQTVLRVRVRRLLKSTAKATAALSKRLIYTIPGTCSLNVTSRSMHVLTGDIQAGKPWTSACHFAAPWSSLAPKMKKGFRLLYQTGCDCPILSCHWWERRCPSAAFFCSWRTSTASDDCQAQHGVCLRAPEGGCAWLGGRMYRGCMKAWRQGQAHVTLPPRGASVASLVPGGRSSYDLHDRDHDTAITSNDVVDGVLEQDGDGAGKRGPSLGGPGLGADTTYSFGPRVVSSRFHKPRKLGPRPPSTNSVYSSRRRKPIKLGSGGRLGFGGLEAGLGVKSPVSLKGGAKTLWRAFEVPTLSKPEGGEDRRASAESPAARPPSHEDQSNDLHSTDARPPSHEDQSNDLHSTDARPPSHEDQSNDLHSTDDEKDPEPEWAASIELGGVYHRRRYPEYTTRIGYIPEN